MQAQTVQAPVKKPRKKTEKKVEAVKQEEIKVAPTPIVLETVKVKKAKVPNPNRRVNNWNTYTDKSKNKNFEEKKEALKKSGQPHGNQDVMRALSADYHAGKSK